MSDETAGTCNTAAQPLQQASASLFNTSTHPLPLQRLRSSPGVRPAGKRGACGSCAASWLCVSKPTEVRLALVAIDGMGRAWHSPSRALLMRARARRQNPGCPREQFWRRQPGNLDRPWEAGARATCLLATPPSTLPWGRGVKRGSKPFTPSLAQALVGICRGQWQSQWQHVLPLPLRYAAWLLCCAQMKM